jgi:hypothetical protein
VYHEVSVPSLSPELKVVDEAAEPFENPPTFVTATGRIIASECRARRVLTAAAAGYAVGGLVLLLLVCLGNISLGWQGLPLVIFTTLCVAPAVGDLHGDMQKTKKVLQLARVAAEKADGKLVWTGGDTVVVQLGDVLDRGDCEIGEDKQAGRRA